MKGPVGPLVASKDSPVIPMKSPLSTRDLQNKYVRGKYNQIFQILDDIMSKTKFGPPYYLNTSGNEIILEEIGTTLQQLAWIDRTGWFITWRLAPLYKDIPSIIEAGNTFSKRLKEFFGGSVKESFETFDEESGRRTAYFVTSVNSIGD
jgi:hypothetical protein